GWAFAPPAASISAAFRTRLAAAYVKHSIIVNSRGGDSGGGGGSDKRRLWQTADRRHQPYIALSHASCLGKCVH
ncbi:unnamed protein product, partial [Ectocarpus sp. 8 AP-2014]